MANTGQPNSAGSQYYITLAPQTQLDGSYAIFGQVFEGLDVVLEIGSVPTDGNDHPIDPVYIDSIRILTPQIEEFYPEENEFTVALDSTVTFMVVSYDDNIEYSWFVNDEDQQFSDFLFFYTFSENGQFEIKCVVSNENDFDYEIVWSINAGTSENDNYEFKITNYELSNFPNPFTSSTTISFTCHRDAENTEISIYNLQGQKVKTLECFNSYETKATDTLFHIDWDGRDENGGKVSSGIYFYKLVSEKESITKKMLLFR